MEFEVHPNSSTLNVQSRKKEFCLFTHLMWTRYTIQTTANLNPLAAVLHKGCEHKMEVESSDHK